MKVKPTILICGTSRITSIDLLCAAIPEGTIPDNADEDTFAPAPETAETVLSGRQPDPLLIIPPLLTPLPGPLPPPAGA